jgi:predicted NBD/HSP70 family sugar kinase
MVILVADIRPNQAFAAVVGLNGRFLEHETLPLVADPERGVPGLIACMKRMQAFHADRSFEGIGRSLPGRVDPMKQTLILSPNLLWSGYDIKGAIEKEIPLHVEMDKAANACLLSELWFGRMDGIRDAVLVTISEGVGTAILANGYLVTGRPGAQVSSGISLLIHRARSQLWPLRPSGGLRLVSCGHQVLRGAASV